MPFIPHPPQVSVECDSCGAELECDGIHYFFDADAAGTEIEAYDWRVVDGRVLCGEDECNAPESTT